MSKVCAPSRPFEIVISDKSRFEVTVSDKDSFDVTVGGFKKRFEVCIPVFNMNYLKYGAGANDLIKLGPVRSYILYK